MSNSVKIWNLNPSKSSETIEKTKEVKQDLSDQVGSRGFLSIAKEKRSRAKERLPPRMRDNNITNYEKQVLIRLDMLLALGSCKAGTRKRLRPPSGWISTDALKGGGKKKYRKKKRKTLKKKRKRKKKKRKTRR